MKNNRAIVLWTGGKDCNLALHEARLKGFEIVRLITFSIDEKEMKAHPTEIMKTQAKSLGIPYEIIPLQKPFEKSYEEALINLKNNFDVETIVTGDIAEVMQQPNWITLRCKAVGLNAFLPLWQLDREEILLKLIDYNFNAIISYAKEPWFTEKWIGRKITHELIQELKELHQLNGVDICGENGEYHTIVIDGPDYQYSVGDLKIC